MKDVILTALTLDDLAAFFDHRIDLAFQRHTTQNATRREPAPGDASPLYVSKREAANLLGCSQGTIDNFARAGKLKRSYLGKSVRFERAQVLGLTKTHTDKNRRNH